MAEDGEEDWVKQLGVTLEKLTAEATHARAWESILLIVIGGRYMSREDPVAAATFDRDALTHWHRSLGNEDIAREVEKIYESLYEHIEIAQRVKAGHGQEKGRTFLHLVPPPDKP